MSELSERIAKLSPDKRELLRRLLADKEAKPASVPDATHASMPKAARDGEAVELPSSFAQQRLWFLDRLSPGGAFYSIFDALPFEGELDVRALGESINEIVRRHESLRTTFKEVDGTAMQLVAARLDVPLPLIDLGQMGPEEREEETARLMSEESERPFDLARGPLLRTTLLRLEEERHLLMVNMHHIISDAWSLDIFERELYALYEAFRQGRPSPLSELPVQYADFAVWQREWLRGAALDEQLCYWRERLTGAPAVLELPTDRPRPSVQTFRGARQSVVLPQVLADELRALGQREGVTLFMTMLAAFDVLLLRYTGQEDMVVGTPIANRTRAELEGLIGFFINTLVLRVSMSGDPGFRTLLKRVREVALGAYAHQDLPFERLVEELQPERDVSRNPLFQVTFQLTNTSEAVDVSEASAQPCDESQCADELAPEVETVAAKFDLLFNVWDGGGGLKVQADYNTDLFDDATVARMLNHYVRILEGVAADPERPVSQLSLLNSIEERRLLVEWNDNATRYPRAACLHELFEAVAERSPDSLAVVFGDERLTYRELNERANQLAHRLRSGGVGPESRVGICTERSAATVVSMLAILKAGGAYVPLDPEYPAERLAYMLEDARVSALITQPQLSKSLPPFYEETLILDDAWESFARESKENMRAGADAENLAYVMYTSGSTGRPKGVAVTHRAVVRLVVDTNYVELSADDRIAQASNSSFDAATFEIWGALLNGARLIGINKEALLSPQSLAAQFRDNEISASFLTTALFNQTVSEIPDTFDSVKTLMVGGDEMNPTRARESLKAGPPLRLLNAYGPTEGTTFTTWHVVEEVPDNTTRVPIGRPLSNTQVYILDSQLRPVPVGVTGELYIGGDGLARGYLNAPSLTASRFVPDPFGTRTGSRLYRTGDSARYLSGGEVEFLGRRDGQIKVRGFRVELGEIEAALRSRAGVRDALVVARKDTSGQRALVAYVVGYEEAEVDASSLRASLKALLPGYMVPSAFVLLDELPLTPNGKIDRAALPDPEQASEEREATVTLPRTPVEEKLGEIFCSVLGLNSVGVYENFFDLGGHSLLATQIVSRIRGLLEVEVSLNSLFISPTIEGLAEVVEEKLKAGKGVTVPAITKVSRAGFRATLSPGGSLTIPDVLKTTLDGN